MDRRPPVDAHVHPRMLLPTAHGPQSTGAEPGAGRSTPGRNPERARGSQAAIRAGRQYTKSGKRRGARRACRGGTSCPGTGPLVLPRLVPAGRSCSQAARRTCARRHAGVPARAQADTVRSRTRDSTVRKHAQLRDKILAQAGAPRRPSSAQDLQWQSHDHMWPSGERRVESAARRPRSACCVRAVERRPGAGQRGFDTRRAKPFHPRGLAHGDLTHPHTCIRAVARGSQLPPSQRAPATTDGRPPTPDGVVPCPALGSRLPPPPDSPRAFGPVKTLWAGVLGAAVRADRPARRCTQRAVGATVLVGACRACWLLLPPWAPDRTVAPPTGGAAGIRRAGRRRAPGATARTAVGSSAPAHLPVGQGGRRLHGVQLPAAHRPRTAAGRQLPADRPWACGRAAATR